MTLAASYCSVVLFSGHKSAVTCLMFDHAAVRLVSGAKASSDDIIVVCVRRGFPLQDNDVIIWDVVNECGQCKLSGHKAPITDCVIMTTSNVLITR